MKLNEIEQEVYEAIEQVKNEGRNLTGNNIAGLINQKSVEITGTDFHWALIGLKQKGLIEYVYDNEFYISLN